MPPPHTESPSPSRCRRTPAESVTVDLEVIDDRDDGPICRVVVHHLELALQVKGNNWPLTAKVISSSGDWASCGVRGRGDLDVPAAPLT